MNFEMNDKCDVSFVVGVKLVKYHSWKLVVCLNRFGIKMFLDVSEYDMLNLLTPLLRNGMI